MNIINSIYRLTVIFILSVFSLFEGCIEPYDADIGENVDLISIDASLVKGENLQKVIISRTTSLSDPEYLPVLGCLVRVIDDQNKVFEFNEVSDGYYSLRIPDSDLIVGRLYKLEVITSSGEVYESEYEKLNGPVEIDSVYYEGERSADDISGSALNGVQFYVDVSAADTSSRYYRWKLFETWEYTATATVTFLYLNADLDRSEYYPLDIYTCYNQREIPELFLSSTQNLVSNEKNHIPLHYLDTRTEKLRIKYSLRIKQYTLNEEAYYYWEQNRVATQDPGGLYNKQPGQPLSNIFRSDNSEEEVLGFFWTASVTQKRIFAYRPPGMFVPGQFCTLEEFDYERHILTGLFPVYIWVDPDTKKEMTASHICFDCTTKGGTLQKPSYWDED